MKTFYLVVLATVLAACGRSIPATEELRSGVYRSANGDEFTFGLDGVATAYRVKFAASGYEVGGSPVTEASEQGIAVIDLGRLVLVRTSFGFKTGSGKYDATLISGGPELQSCAILQKDGAIELTDCDDNQPWDFAGAGNWMAPGSLRLNAVR